MSSAQENLEALRVSTTSEASAAALADHEALVKARAEIQNLEENAELLKAEHTKALQEVESQLEILKEKAAISEELAAQVARLKEEKEENAGKLSELEIEILELKESQETIEEQRERSLASVKSLEDQLAKAASTAQQVDEEFKAKAADRAAHLEQLEAAHQEALQAASEQQKILLASLEAIRTELTASQAARDGADANAREAAEQHVLKIEQAEQENLQKQSEFIEQIKKISAELEVRDIHNENAHVINSIPL